MSERAHIPRVLTRGDLVADGAYRVHSRFKRAVNLRDERTVLSVVAADVDSGPSNLVIDRLDPGAIRDVRVEGESIWFDGVPISTEVSRRYDSSFNVRGADVRMIRRNLAQLSSLVAWRAPTESLAFLLDVARVSLLRPGFERSYAAHAINCASDIFRGDALRGVSRVKGCGFGLTPSGDDFIVGVLISMRFIEQATGRDLGGERAALAGAARTGTLLSDWFLDLAAHGRVFASMRSLVGAMAFGSFDDVEQAFERVSSVGATSGVDAAVGLCLGVGSGLHGWPSHGLRRAGHALATRSDERGAAGGGSEGTTGPEGENTPWS